jgi:hypothetical protein
LILKSKEFALETAKYIKKVIELFIERGENFKVVSESANVLFSPPVPEIAETLGKHVRFDLAGYSFETSRIDDEKLIFRAGFNTSKGTVESEVTIKIIHIVQIMSDKNGEVVMTNFAKPENFQNREEMFLSRNRDIFSK